ncbi:MAG: 6-carboxytetrahydropterin synthase QueD [Spirochaetales bacterium]|nr:6-carboxytetrahydropterin synthase QueD [Spirochaetales bacterium]
MKIDVTKIFTFDSAHSLVDYDGACQYLHGHTYKLEVTVRGERDSSGMVIDFTDLKAVVKENVLDLMDHKFLNEVFDFNTTCENMIVWIFDILNRKISDNRLFLQKIVLWETPTCFATLEREQFLAQE